MSKPVSMFTGRPLLVIGFDTSLSCRETIFPAITCGITFPRDTLFRFGAKQLRTHFRGSLAFYKMSKKTDVIDQARLAAYFAEMQEDFFEHKLRRIVSFYLNFFPNTVIIAHLNTCSLT